jgi:hypothetical protein
MSRRKQRAMRAPPAALVEALAAVGPEPGYDDVHTVEDAASVARARVAWQEKRRAVAEAHRKRSRVTDVEAMQERHSPTVEIAVDDGAGKRTRANYTRVRQSEAWRHNQLSGMQRQAELEMMQAWKNRTAGTGLRTFAQWSGPIDGGHRDDRNDQGVLELTWLEFVREAKRRRVNRRVIISILTEPRTLGEIEQRHRLQKGRAYTIYVRGLDLWCVLRGWVRPGRFGGYVDNSP